MKTKLPQLSKALVFLGAFFACVTTRAATIYYLPDGSYLIATVDRANAWMFQEINDTAGFDCESGVMTQRGAYSQITQLFGIVGTPVSVWTDDGGYTDIYSEGVSGKTAGSSINTMDSYYSDGIGRFGDDWYRAQVAEPQYDPVLWAEATGDGTTYTTFDIYYTDW